MWKIYLQAYKKFDSKTMFNHCKSYKCNTHRILSAVLAILLGMTYVCAITKSDFTDFPRIALLGDSMTWIGGDSCQNPTGWSHLLKESGIARSIDVYARSGATWTNTSSTTHNPSHYSELLHDDNVLYNQAIRLIKKADSCDESPDIIVLFAGANDAWFAARRPGLFDIDETDNTISSASDPSVVRSLAGSVRLVRDMLIERFPDTTLLFVTPLQMSKTDAETIFKVSDIIEKVAYEKECPVLRADRETGITHEQEALYPRYTYDGVHTNIDGAGILGKYIIGFLHSLITEN